MTRIIGIDPSWTGLALHDGTHRDLISTVDTIKATKKKAAQTFGRCTRLHTLLTGVREFVKAAPTDLVMIENYSFGSKQGREIAGELGGSIRYWLWQEKIPMIEVPPTTLKKWVGGSGKADKAMMLRDVYVRWGYMATDDNDADAYALNQLGVAYMAWTNTGQSSMEEATLFKSFSYLQ